MQLPSGEVTSGHPFLILLPCTHAVIWTSKRECGVRGRSNWIELSTKFIVSCKFAQEFPTFNIYWQISSYSSEDAVSHLRTERERVNLIIVARFVREKIFENFQLFFHMASELWHFKANEHSKYFHWVVTRLCVSTFHTAIECAVSFVHVQLRKFVVKSAFSSFQEQIHISPQRERLSFLIPQIDILP